MLILHLISGLSVGGAEGMLYKLLSRMDKSFLSNHVVSLTTTGVLGRSIESLGVHVTALGMKRGVPDPRHFFCLTKLLRKIKPDLVQTWMYHADLMGGVAAKLAGNIPVVWNIRHSNLSFSDNKKTTFLTARTCSLLSKWVPEKIICCSESSKRTHLQYGYFSKKIEVITNGFNLELFKPDFGARNSFREELGMSKNIPLFGMVARFDPQKDFVSLITAISILKNRNLKFFVVLCGNDISLGNEKLTKCIKKFDVEDVIFLLGVRHDIPRVLSGLDIAVLSSAYGEGFPNVLGEAMSCEVPCVATDVGDSAEIIGDTGLIVPPRDPVALANALKKMIELGHEGRMALGKKARQRIHENYELSSVVKKYEDLYREVLA